MKAYKTELNPNNRQASYFGRCCGIARFVYNWALAECSRRYEEGETISPSKLRVEFNAKKDELCPWVIAVPYAVTESAFRNLDAAFKNFFRRVKKGEKEPGYPKRKKRGDHNSFQLRGVKVTEDAVYIPRLGWVRLKEQGYIPADADYGVYATISERAGRWFISVLVHEGNETPIETRPVVIGIDFGIKSLAVLSTGEVFENPQPLATAQWKMRRLQKELSRRKKGGSNRRKTRQKLARAHFDVANVRKHHLHQLSSYVTETLRPARIVLEDLNVAGMVQNHHLARAISDVGFGELRRQIEYKAAQYGIDVILAHRFFPSSKTCSACGCIKEELSLSERTYHCDECGLVLDRDLNAARNLAAVGNRETHGDCLGS